MAQKYKIEWPFGEETRSKVVALKSAVKIGTGPKATIKVAKDASKNVKPNHVTIALLDDAPRISLKGPVWINGDPYTEGEYGLDDQDTFVLGHEDNTQYTWSIFEAEEAEGSGSAEGEGEEEGSKKEKTPEKKTPAKKDGKKTPTKKGGKKSEEDKESSAEEPEKTPKGKAPKGKAGKKEEAPKGKKGAAKTTKLTKKKGQAVKKPKKKANEDSSSAEETSDEFEEAEDSVDEKDEIVKDKEAIHLSPPHRHAKLWKVKKGEKRTRAQPDRLDPKIEPALKRARTEKTPIEYKAPPARTEEELDHLTIRDCVIEAVELNPGKSRPQLHSFVDRYYKPLRVNRDYYNGLIARLLEADEISTANGLLYEKGQAPDEEVADEASQEEKDEEMKEDASED